MIRTALISAAGRGTRMRELAADRPKHLIPVLGRPFIDHVLERLAGAGIERMILVIGHLREAWSGYLAETKYPLTIVDQFARLGEKYGTACPIEAAESEIGSEGFLAINGDNLYSPDDLRALLINDAFTYVAGLPHEHPERYGVLVRTPNGTLDRIVEKPENPIAAGLGNLINTSLYKFTPDVFERVKRLSLSPRGEFELTDAVSKLAAEGKVRVHLLRDYWKDFGRPEDIPEMEAFLRAHAPSSESHDDTKL